MPVGEIDADRTDQYLALSLVRASVSSSAARSTISLTELARAVRATLLVGERGGRLGFITPLTDNFCEACNRVRVACTGTLYDRHTLICVSTRVSVTEGAADVRCVCCRRSRGQEPVAPAAAGRAAPSASMSIPPNEQATNVVV